MTSLKDLERAHGDVGEKLDVEVEKLTSDDMLGKVFKDPEHAYEVISSVLSDEVDPESLDKDARENYITAADRIGDSVQGIRGDRSRKEFINDIHNDEFCSEVVISFNKAVKEAAFHEMGKIDVLQEREVSLEEINAYTVAYMMKNEKIRPVFGEQAGKAVMMMNDAERDQSNQMIRGACVEGKEMYKSIGQASIFHGQLSELNRDIEEAEKREPSIQEQGVDLSEEERREFPDKDDDAPAI